MKILKVSKHPHKGRAHGPEGKGEPMNTVDPTEDVRRQLQSEINAAAAERSELENRYGRVWDTKQLGEDFEVIGFLAPFCTVKRRFDGKRGTVEFQHRPRFYFSFEQD